MMSRLVSVSDGLCGHVCSAPSLVCGWSADAVSHGKFVCCERTPDTPGGYSITQSETDDFRWNTRPLDASMLKEQA